MRNLDKLSGKQYELMASYLTTSGSRFITKEMLGNTSS